jgi:hypothetical protein
MRVALTQYTTRDRLAPCSGPPRSVVLVVVCSIEIGVDDFTLSADTEPLSNEAYAEIV